MYDLIVIGLGVYGSAVIAEAATKGLRVLGVDQFAPPHAHGSTHGNSRVFRLTTVEAEEYVPRAKRALELWHDYDDGSLIVPMGFALIAQDGTAAQTHHGVEQLIDRARGMAERQGIAHELTDGGRFMERFPGLKIQSDDKVFYEPGACVIRPERAVQLMQERAVRAGAEVRINTTASNLKLTADGVTVKLGDDLVSAKRAVVCTGPWQHKELLGLSENPIAAVLQPQVIISLPSQPLAKGDEFPGFVYMSPGKPLVYALPPADGLEEIKLGIEQETVSVATTDRSALPANFVQNMTQAAQELTHSVLPAVDARNPKTSLCLYTVTEGSKHIVRNYDAGGRVVLVSACSGHGFKYAPALAESICQSFVKN